MRDGEGAGRGPLLVLAGAVALLLAIVLAAVLSIASAPGPGGKAAELVPASALAFARLTTDRDDPTARRLMRTITRLPGYAGVRDAALTAISPAPGAFDPRRDVQPWLGKEAAIALVDIGGGRYASVVLAQVRSRPRAEGLLQRVAGEEPAVRYRGVVLRRFSGSAAAFSHGFLLAGPEPAVRRALDVAEGGAPSLADASEFKAALGRPRRPAAAYLSARGLRGFLRPRGGLGGAIGALLDHRGLRAAAAALHADAQGLRAQVRLTGAGGSTLRPRLLTRVPAGAVALLTGPSLAAAVQAAQRAGAGAVLDPVRATVRRGARLDLDRDVVNRLGGEFAAWLEPGAGAPVITLAARTRDLRGTRLALAKLQAPVARALAGQPAAARAFELRTIAGVDAFTLPVSPGFAPTYALVRDTVIASTSPSGLEGWLGRRPRLAAARAFRAALPGLPARVETLAFSDVSRLLAIAAQTGLGVDAFRPVRAATVVVARDGDDATADLAVDLR